VWFKYNKVLLRKILPLVIVLLLGGVIISGCTQIGGQPKGWSGGVIADDTLFLGSMEGKLIAVSTSDGSRLWEVPFEVSKQATGGFGCTAPSTTVAIYGTPVVAGELVYVSGYNGKVYAISSSKGVKRWVYPREGNLEPIVGGVAVALGKVYFGSSDGKLYTLDAATGDWEWDFQTGGKIWSTPAINGDTLFIGSFDKKLYALNAADGSKKWEFETGGAIASTPLVSDNTVYIGSFDRYLYAIDATDGSLKWKFMAENWFWAKPVAYNNTIYVGNLDGKVYILNAETGKEKVDPIDLDSPISSSPVLVGKLVIITTEKGAVYALDTENNQIRLLIDLEEKIYASLSRGEGVVYVHTQEGTLYEVDTQTGVIKQLYSIE